MTAPSQAPGMTDAEAVRAVEDAASKLRHDCRDRQANRLDKARKHFARLAKTNATLLAERDALRNVATEAATMRENFRCVLRVNCKCDDEFVDRQTERFDAAIDKAAQGEKK